MAKLAINMHTEHIGTGRFVHNTIFTARRYASVVYAMALCPSVSEFYRNGRTIELLLKMFIAPE